MAEKKSERVGIDERVTEQDAAIIKVNVLREVQANIEDEILRLKKKFRI